MNKQSMEDFFADPSQETFSGVCNALISAVVYGLLCIVPTKFETDDELHIHYYLVPTASGRYGYAMCNSEEEFRKCSSKGGVVIPVKTMLQNLLDNDDPSISCVIINPYYKFGGAFLSLSRTNARFILDNAEQLIESADPITQRVLRDGLRDK